MGFRGYEYGLQYMETSFMALVVVGDDIFIGKIAGISLGSPRLQLCRDNINLYDHIHAQIHNDGHCLATKVIIGRLLAVGCM